MASNHELPCVASDAEPSPTGIGGTGTGSDGTDTEATGGAAALVLPGNRSPQLGVESRPSSKRSRAVLAPAADSDEWFASSLEDGDPMICEPRPAKRRRMDFGAIALAAMDQWGLDEAMVARWASRRGLPGVGFAELLDFRRENPVLDVSAGLADMLQSA